jgi:DNA-binding transcriptional LysR family regulator
LGELDAAIDVMLPRAPNMSFEPLAGGLLVVAARRDHPRVSGSLDLRTYLELDHVLATSRRHGPGLEDVALQRAGHQRNVAVRCQHYWTACQLVARTDLVLTMPERYASFVNAVLGNQVMPFPLKVPANDVYIYWHANSESEPGNVWLRSQIKACFPEEISPS